MEPEKPRTSDLQRAEIIKALLEEFHDKEFREGYVEDFYNAKIATQINVLRNQRRMSQKELGERAEMAQERISVLEDVNYNRWTLNVLRRLGDAFGLVVDVEFKEYGEFIKEFKSFGPDSLKKRSFDEDPVFSGNADNALIASSRTETVNTGESVTNYLRVLLAEKAVVPDPSEFHQIDTDDDLPAPGSDESDIIEIFQLAPV